MAIERNQCSYTSCYCEENIYKLIESLLALGKSSEKLQVLFISNKKKAVPLFYQAAAKMTLADSPVVFWDYHVILIEEKEGGNSLVWDLDTSLAFPCPSEEYFTKTIRSELNFKEEYKRCFRVIPSTIYLDIFSSDRSHMLKEDGTYLSSPPSWPAIWKGKDSLQPMISMEEPLEGTNIYSEDSFPFLHTIR